MKKKLCPKCQDKLIKEIVKCYLLQYPENEEHFIWLFKANKKKYFTPEEQTKFLIYYAEIMEDLDFLIDLIKKEMKKYEN